MGTEDCNAGCGTEEGESSATGGVNRKAPDPPFSPREKRKARPQPTARLAQNQNGGATGPRVSSVARALPTLLFVASGQKKAWPGPQDEGFGPRCLTTLFLSALQRRRLYT
jgi:hypothetical protein